MVDVCGVSYVDKVPSEPSQEPVGALLCFQGLTDVLLIGNTLDCLSTDPFVLSFPRMVCLRVSSSPRDAFPYTALFLWPARMVTAAGSREDLVEGLWASQKRSVSIVVCWKHGGVGLPHSTYRPGLGRPWACNWTQGTVNESVMQ